MITLRKLNDNNIWDVVDLSVYDEQKNFVATNNDSIIEAYANISDGYIALPFAIYNDETLVGFVMFGYGTYADEDFPKVAPGNYFIWRFMIDKNYQGKGLGKAALDAALDYIYTMPCGQAKYCWLSYEPENTAAKALYSSRGFKENGEMCGEEVVSVKEL